MMSQLLTHQNHGGWRCVCVFGFGYAKCRFQHNVTKFQPIAQTIFRIEYLILRRNENEHCQTRCTRDIIRTAVRQGTRDERERESKNSGCANWAKIPTKQTIYRLQQQQQPYNSSTRYTISVSQFIFHVFTLLSFEHLLHVVLLLVVMLLFS